MSDRRLAFYEEPRLPDGPRWTLEVQRSARGERGLFVTIRHEYFDSDLQAREMTIMIEDGLEVLAPVMDWLQQGRVTIR